MDEALPDAELKKQYGAIRHHRANGLSEGHHAPASASPVANQEINVQSRAHSTIPNAFPEMLLQPETRPISHAKLAAEVKGIYAGLVMVEAKCVDVDEKQSIAAQEKDPARQTKLSNEQWQALIALHRTLLHEHHDFFLASQHPSAGPALTRLAAQYSMPARMWRHGIHSFLEVLRHRLPDSLDHMLAFIYIAYSMMALLYETVTAFEDTWIECLGDWGRYRMAIEDDEPDGLLASSPYRVSKALSSMSKYITSLAMTLRYGTAKAVEDARIECLSDLGWYRMAMEDVDGHDRETWSGVTRFWYGKAADRNPYAGRLYHHLAILARPVSFEQLSFYTRSLICTQPFITARSSIITVFEPFFAAWAYRPVKKLSFWPNRAVRGLAFALSIRLASASNSGNDLSPAPKTGREWPFGPSVPSFSSWPFAVSGMLLAGLSPLLARRLGPSRVSGTLMAVFGFVWLRINDDETTTPVVLWTTFLLDIYFMWYYAGLQNRFTQGYALITLLLGIILDFGAARLFSPPNTGVFLDELMRLSPLMFSLALFISTYAASQAHRHHGAELRDTVGMEEGLAGEAA